MHRTIFTTKSPAQSISGSLLRNREIKIITTRKQILVKYSVRGKIFFCTFLGFGAWSLQIKLTKGRLTGESDTNLLDVNILILHTWKGSETQRGA